MIPGRHYNHDPRHFRFERQLQDHNGLDDRRGRPRLSAFVCILVLVIEFVILMHAFNF